MNRRAVPVGRQILRIATLPICLLLFGGCADDGGIGGSGGGGPLEGVSWVLDRASVEALVRGAPSQARVDLRFEGGEVAGRSACNSYGGPYEVDGAGISFGALAMTEMACEPALMEIEAAYLAALAEVREYRVNGDDLLLTAGGVRLVFARETKPEPAPLVGTTWTLDALGIGGDAVASPLAGTDASVVFGDDGVATGVGGCNRFRAGYEADGDSIAFDPVAGTKMACEPDVLEQESAVFAGFEQAATFAIEGEVLTLLDSDGVFLMSLRGN